MLPSRSAVDNLIQVVLHAQNHCSAQQVLLELLQYYYNQWQQTPQPNIARQVLTTLQAFCELGLGWQNQFDQLLAAMQLQHLQQPFWQQIDFSAMIQKPTYSNLAALLRWRSCRQNPLQPNKKELVALLHSICQTTPGKQYQYTFYSSQHIYLLYWQTEHWHLQDCSKQVTWHFCK